MKQTFLVTLIFLFSVITNSLCYADDISYDADDWYNASTNSYEYPITPSSPEWLEFNSYQEMVNACQIPNSLLEKLSTTELLDLVCKHPLLINIYLFDSVSDGYYELSKTLNGIKELRSRKDFYDVLLDTYSQYTTVSDSDSLSVLSNITKYEFLEIMLLAEENLSSATELQQKKLSRLADEISNRKANDNAYFADTYSVYTTAIDSDTIGYLNNNSNLLNPSNLSMTTFSSLPNLDAPSIGSTDHYIYTPRGTAIKIEKGIEEDTPEEIKIYTEQIKKAYPKATCIAPASSCYNCHSYVWYKRSPLNKYWLRTPQYFLLDGSYRAVGNYPTYVGQKMAWQTKDRDNKPHLVHSGFVHHFSYPAKPETTYIESKWTKGPVMICSVTYYPHTNTGTPTYYTENK